MAKKICNQGHVPHDHSCQNRAIYHVWPPEVASGPAEGPGVYSCEEHLQESKTLYPQGCYATNLLVGSIDWHPATRRTPAEEGEAAGRAEARAALDEKGQPLHECGMAYMDSRSDNIKQREYLETSLRPKGPVYTEDEVVVRRMSRGGWRAYYAEYISTYCQRQGGSVHVRIRAIYNHDGSKVQAPSLTSLLGTLVRLPFLAVAHPNGLTHKRMLAAMAANRY
ncbi:hypothetical protein LCGC14_2869180 [marine sediment metagenome]|uniref:Uncharacterized protein n=1 Tax=marine sediment metagenome TaxID=412755 RepID=A0A0F8Y3D6_9ZZZZ